MSIPASDKSKGMNKRSIVAQWVHEYSDEMYTWTVHKISDQSATEDLVQETFISAFQSFEKFQNKSSPKTWLFAILKNKIFDYYRQHVKLVSLSDDEQNKQLENIFDSDDQWKNESKPHEWDLDDKNLLDDIEFGGILQTCLEKLPSQWLSCIQLKYIGIKEGEEICQVLGLTSSNYWQMLHRAKLQVRICLENNWFNA